MRTRLLGAVFALLLAVVVLAGCTSTVEGKPSFAEGAGDATAPRSSSGTPSTGPSSGPTSGPDNPDNTGSSIEEPVACIQGSVDARQALDLFKKLKNSDPIAKWKRTADQVDDIRRKLGNVAAPLPEQSKIRATLADMQEELRKAALTLRAGTYDIGKLLRQVDEFKRICSNL